MQESALPSPLPSQALDVISSIEISLLRNVTVLRVSDFCIRRSPHTQRLEQLDDS